MFLCLIILLQILQKTLVMPKIVISDTSCLIILSNINELNILKDLYGEIYTTIEIIKEFGEPLPEWIVIRSSGDLLIKRSLEQQIDKGEASAIALAMETPDCILILDDLKARKIAEKYGLKITGTLGVILRAYEKGVVKSVKLLLDKMKKSGFRINDEIEREIIKRSGEI